jgi:RNase H-fold protein (predicted Holliday junction resolvase)
LSGGEASTVVAVDPGRFKCGVAVVARTPDGVRIMLREITGLCDLPDRLDAVIGEYRPTAVIVGTGTGSDKVAAVVTVAARSLLVKVSEQFTTLEARKRYFRECPPSGLRRLIPVSLLSPPVPYDDWAAVILAERYLSEH